MAEESTDKALTEEDDTVRQRAMTSDSAASGTAAADAATEEDLAAGGSGDTSAGRSFRRVLSGLVPKLAIVVAAIATLIAGSLWWQYRQFYVELSNEDAMLLSNLEGARATMRELEQALSAVGNGRSADRAEIEGLRGDIELLPVEIRALDRRIEALQGGQIDARDNWLREQAEYYLVLANTELRLAGRIDTAIEALELADDVLRDLGDPALTDVRGAVAAELQALRSVVRVDLEGLAAELGGLAARVPELPTRAAAPENYRVPDEALDDVEPGLGRLWASAKGAVTSIVRIERQDAPVGVVLTEAERQMARRQLALELQIARSALLDRRQQTFRAGLLAADAILNQDFEREAQSIVEARRLLGDMLGTELDPAMPDIGDSLALLRAAAGSN